MSDKMVVVPYQVDQGLVSATVIDIRWQRIFLYITVKIEYAAGADKTAPPDFYFVDSNYYPGFMGKIVSQEDQTYTLEINITNNGASRAIACGEYAIIVVQNKVQVARARLSYEIAARLEEVSRNFLYSNKNRVFSISFVLDGDDDRLPFYMYILPAQKVGAGTPPNLRDKPKKKPLVLNPKTRAVNWFNKNNKRLITSMYWKYRAQKPAGEKYILFYSEQSDTLGSNITAVRDRMKKRGLDKEYHFEEYSCSIKEHPSRSNKHWVDYLKKVAYADIILMDDHSPTFDWLTLDTGTKIIQLWHAGAGFKSSGYSRWGHLGCPSPWSCHRQYSYGIAGSRKIAHFFSEVWGMNTSRVLPTGMPRLDEYLDEDHRKKTVEHLYKKFPAAKGKKVILFAPTYRGTDRSNAFYPYDMIDFDRFAQVCGDEYIVFFKMHPWVSAGTPIPDKYKNIFFDVGSYPNINNLFYITDLLITDYSSSIFEYSLMRKPMLFFAFDEVQYSLSRGFHRPYRESAPGKVCAKFSELMDAIEKKDFEYEKVEEYVSSSFDYIDTHSSDRVIDWLILGNIPEELQKEIDREDAIGKRLARLDFKPPFAEREEIQ